MQTNKSSGTKSRASNETIREPSGMGRGRGSVWGRDRLRSIKQLFIDVSLFVFLVLILALVF
jgi:hypothetical protein